MRRHRCPKPEKLLEALSIPEELSFFSKTRLKFHSWTCKDCQQKIESIQKKMETVFSPEADITSSLVSVYSKLQQDETLMLRGWKIGEMSSRPQKAPSQNTVSSWVFRGAVAAGVALTVVLTWQDQKTPGIQVADRSKAPFAEIRYEDGDRTEVHYVEPELYHSMEFETTNVSHTR